MTRLAVHARHYPQANIQWDPEHLSSTSCTQGPGWVLEWYCTLKDPINAAKLMLISLDSTASGSAIHVATLNLAVKTTTSVVSGITGSILTTTRRVGSTYTTDPASFIFAGTASVALNGATRRMRMVGPCRYCPSRH